jgi:predicted nucleic acid-binding protein
MRGAVQAAICLEVDLPLATRNTRHFEDVKDVEVIHPDEWAVRSAGS